MLVLHQVTACLIRFVYSKSFVLWSFLTQHRTSLRLENSGSSFKIEIKVGTPKQKIQFHIWPVQLLTLFFRSKQRKKSYRKHFWPIFFDFGFVFVTRHRSWRLNFCCKYPKKTQISRQARKLLRSPFLSCSMIEKSLYLAT